MKFSKLEIEISELVGAGLTLSEISKELGVPVRLIEAHKQELKRKLGMCPYSEMTTMVESCAEAKDVDHSKSVWELIEDALGMKLVVETVAGGCIHQSALLTGRAGQLFVKTNSLDKLPMLISEWISLEALEKTQTVRVPEVFGRGEIGNYSYLALEYIPMKRGQPKQFRQLGEQLAALHRSEPLPLFQPIGSAKFGFFHDGFIGTTPQPNTCDIDHTWRESCLNCRDWATFFAKKRIGFQLQLAAEKGHRFEHADKLLARIPDLFAGHEPEPSLLHGDLWSGNVGFARDGTPVIYDPACYYGDRETDIAFAEMFGGFAPEFYAGYRSVYPLAEGYEQRRDVYNLYHVLNHHNLFGGSYGEQATSIIRRLLVGF